MAILSGIVLYWFLIRLTTILLILKPNRELNSKKNITEIAFYIQCICIVLKNYCRVYIEVNL